MRSWDKTISWVYGLVGIKLHKWDIIISGGISCRSYGYSCGGQPLEYSNSSGFGAGINPRGSIMVKPLNNPAIPRYEP